MPKGATDRALFPDHDNVDRLKGAFRSVRIGGYRDDKSGYSGYEIQAKKGGRWTVVGYVKPFTFQVHWLKRSQWLSDQLGQLVKDIQAYEAIMKERIKNGI